MRRLGIRGSPCRERKSLCETIKPFLYPLLRERYRSDMPLRTPNLSAVCFAFLFHFSRSRKRGSTRVFLRASDRPTGVSRRCYMLQAFVAGLIKTRRFSSNEVAFLEALRRYGGVEKSPLFLLTSRAERAGEAYLVIRFPLDVSVPPSLQRGRRPYTAAVDVQSSAERRQNLCFGGGRRSILLSSLPVRSPREKKKVAFSSERRHEKRASYYIYCGFPPTTSFLFAASQGNSIF